jgi:hypothetical protein
MTKWTIANQRRIKAKTEQTPAIWRGIGCLLCVIIPLMSWVLAVATVQVAVAAGWPLPYQLLGYPTLPLILWKAPGLVPVLAYIQSQQNLYAIMAIALTYVIVAGGLMSVVYAVVYRFVGPSRYGPYDAPPPKISVGRYKR